VFVVYVVGSGGCEVEKVRECFVLWTLEMERAGDDDEGARLWGQEYESNVHVMLYETREGRAKGMIMVAGI